MSWNLIADIGGTNARFARVEGGKLLDVSVYPSDSVSVLDAVKDFTGMHSGRPRTILSAAAGPVFDGRIHLTNIDQIVDVDQMKHAAEAEQAIVINDFEAAAWAMATVDDSDVCTLRGDVLRRGHRLVLGPGTGLGVGALLYLNSNYQALPGEGGHVTLAPKTDIDRQVFEQVLTLWPDVRTAANETALEAEAILSGRGIPILYRACVEVVGNGNAEMQIQDIMQAAQDKAEESAVLMASIFRRYLGQVAGDLAITIQCDGGIFLVGGVATKNPWLFEDAFLEAIDAGGRFQEMRSGYNVHLYQRDDFGLVGAANALILGVEQ